MSNGKKLLHIVVRDKIATLVNSDEFLVCGNSDYEVHFDFDEDWARHSAKTALFVYGNTTVSKPFTGTVCDGVPVEKATKCYIGVYAGDISATTKAEVRCLLSIKDIATTPAPPSQDVYDRIINLINSITITGGGGGIVEVSQLPSQDINTNVFYKTAEGVYWYENGWNKIPDEYEMLALLVNPDYEENDENSKAFIRNRPFYDSRRADGSGRLVPLPDKYLDLANREEFQVVEALARGATQGVSYVDYAEMVEDLLSSGMSYFTVGQSIYIDTMNVPDLWITGVSDESKPYIFVDDTQFVKDLTNGRVQIGNFILAPLETGKVNIEGFVKDTDYASEARAGIVKILQNSGLNVDEGVLSVLFAKDYEIDSRNSGVSLTPANIGHAIKRVLTGYKTVGGVGEYGNHDVELTDEEKAIVNKWLGSLVYEDESLAKHYTVSSYSNQWSSGHYLELATTDIIPYDELGLYSVTAKYEDTGEISTAKLSEIGSENLYFGRRLYFSVGGYTADIFIITDYMEFQDYLQSSYPKSNGLYFCKHENYDGSNDNSSNFTSIVSVDRVGAKPLDSQFINIPFAGYDKAGLVKTTNSTTSTVGFKACPIINGVPYYEGITTNAQIGFGYATCSGAETSTNKTASLYGYKLTTGGIVSIRFVAAVPANSTLNINAQGAKNIYHKNALITSGIIKAGDIATFIYNGSNYILISVI